MFFFLTELGHFAVSGVVSFFCFRRFKTSKSLILPLISGFLVDLDHFIDYFLYRGPHFNLRDFISGTHYHSSNQVYIIFHSWELVLLFLIASYATKKKDIFIPLALGLAGHLLWDHLTNPALWYSYFLTGRFLVGFELTKLFIW